MVGKSWSVGKRMRERENSDRIMTVRIKSG